MTDTDLKPCPNPWCSHTNGLYVVWDLYSRRVCCRCGVKGPMSETKANTTQGVPINDGVRKQAEKEAVAAWNTRPSPTREEIAVKRSDIYAALRSYTLSNMSFEDEPENPYPLVDLLSNDGDTIKSGEQEMELLADHIASTLTPSPVAGIDHQGIDRMKVLVNGLGAHAGGMDLARISELKAILNNPIPAPVAGWRGMDDPDLPMDGTQFLSMQDDWGPFVTWRDDTWNYPWRFLDRDNEVNGFRDGEHGPTRWKPLDAAPAPTGQPATEQPSVAEAARVCEDPDCEFEALPTIGVPLCEQHLNEFEEWKRKQASLRTLQGDG